MYMVKRVFKNKRLMRSLLILVGLVIVGFFVWRALFKRSSVFEGQEGQQGQLAVDTALENCPMDDNMARCLAEKLGNKISEEMIISGVIGCVENNSDNPSVCINNTLVQLWNTASSTALTASIGV